jgi:hypothetical protein
MSEADDPIPGARVSIATPEGEVVGSALTDPKGRWRAAIDAPVGATLTIRVEVDGFPTATTGIRPDQISVRTTVAAQPIEAVELDVVGERVLPEPVPAQPTRYVLTETLLTKLPGTRGDPFAAVTSLPSLGRPPALSTVYVVRGAGPEETVTFVDGAPLPNAFHFGGLVSILPAAFVRSISVIPGSFGVRYGRATAGVIDVDLASPRADAVHGTIVLDAIDVGATLSAPLVPGRRDTTIAIGARRSHVDAWLGGLVGDQIAGDLPRYLDGQVVVEHAFSPRSRVRAAFLGADDSVSVSDQTAPEDRPRRGTWRSSAMRAHARYEARSEAGAEAMAVFSVGRSSDTIIGETDDWRSTRSTLFGRLEATIPIAESSREARREDVRFTIGTDVLATRVEGVRSLGIPTSSFGGSALFALRGSLEVARVEPGVYAQLVISPAKGITFTPGIRVDRAPLGEILLQPRLSSRAEISSTTALRGAAGVQARSNPLDAVDARDFDGTLLPVPIEPRPVRGQNVSAGIEHALSSNIQVSLDVYGRASNGVLVAVQGQAIPQELDPSARDRGAVAYLYRLNGQEARTRAVGAEFLVKVTEHDLSAFLGYAVARAEIKDSPEATWRRAPFDQTHVLNAAVVYALGKGWEAGARFRLALGVLDSPYPATEIAPKADAELDPSRPLPALAPLHSLDVRIEKGWTFGENGRVAVYVEVRNVYDRRTREPLAYNYVYGYPVVGNGLPIIPNIGVRGAL